MERIKEFDYLKAIAAISVIVIHVTGPYSGGAFSYYINQIARYAVPLFIIMSGALLYNSNQFKKLKYFDFIFKRLKKIYIPYIVWTLVYFSYKTLKSGNSFTGIEGFSIKLLKALIYGTGYDHLYFIVIILQLYILFPFLKLLCEKRMNETLIASFILTFSFQLALYLSLLHKIILPVFIIPYYIFFPTWVFFFVLGIYAMKNIKKIKEVANTHYVIIPVIWTISLIVLLVDSKTTNTNGSSIKPSVILYCVTSFLFFYLIAGRIQSRWRTFDNFIKWVSLQSFCIYFSHLLLKQGILLIARRAGISMLWDGSKGMLLLLVATIAASLGFVYIMSFSPIIEYIGGAPRKKNTSLQSHKL